MKTYKAFFLTIMTCCLLLISCGNSQTNDSTTQTHSHTYTTTVVAPTCIDDGYSLNTCSCGASYKDNITPALGHDYFEREQNYKCSRCGRYEDEGFGFELITNSMAQSVDGYKDFSNSYFVNSVSSSCLENGKVTLPRKHMGYSVTGITKGALYNVREQIIELDIPSTLKYIGSCLVTYDGQFSKPNKTISLKTIVFNSKCAEMNISHSSFQFCSNVTSILMPNNCIKLFNHDDLVANHFLFEDTPFYSVNKIEENGCYYLFNILFESDRSKINSKLIIREGTSMISNQAFKGNTNIKTIELPSSVIYIGKYSFAQCSNLSKIVYNGSEESYRQIVIEDNAFQDCNKITYEFK
jgi:hypothetical protein